MSYGVKLRVWGDYASFNRPEMKVERVTYEVMTPSAARGILEAIHWKPGMRWVIDAIHVLRPIRFTPVRRNEISTKIPTKGALGLAMKGRPAALGIAVEEYCQQRAAIVLRDVAYGIAAHVVVLRPDAGPDGQPLEHPEAKHLETFRRRAAKGQCFHQPYLGTREFPAAFELVDSFPQGPDELRGQTPVQSEDIRQKLEVFLRALREGVQRYADVDSDGMHTKYFVLALAPNAARLAVRLFLQGTVRDLLENLRRHYRDMGVEHQYGEGSKHPDPEFPPAWLLLRQTARDPDGIPPILAGPLLRAILTGSRYPDALYSAVIRRLAADRTVNYLRACIIRGYLVRNQNWEVSMSLDKERTDPAYRAGRLFAALEKTQADALGTVNASIRERFYSAASATPRSVFPRLLRTYQHHLANLEGGRKVNRERLVQEIVDPLVEFPAHLDLAEQGLFALGYYHQMNEFSRPRDAATQK